MRSTRLHLGNKFDSHRRRPVGPFRRGLQPVSVAPAAAFTQIIGLPSWRGALVYKPKPNGSIYFDAGNSFNPSAETLSLSAANANTPPEKSLTYEGGTQMGSGFRQSFGQRLGFPHGQNQRARARSE